jgi:hypothetical protein
MMMSPLRVPVVPKKSLMSSSAVVIVASLVLPEA